MYQLSQIINKNQTIEYSYVTMKNHDFSTSLDSILPKSCDSLIPKEWKQYQDEIAESASRIVMEDPMISLLKDRQRRERKSLSFRLLHKSDLPFAWEQRKLGSFTKSYSGGTPSVGKSDYYSGSIPFIRSAEINAYSTELFLTEQGLNNSSAKMVCIGDVLYALYGATSGEVGRSRLCGAINQAILAIKPTNNDDLEFIAQWLRGQKITIINTYLQGGQGNLSGNIVKDLVVTKPTDKAEQTAIGSFFAALDRLITLHQREFIKLQNMEKALLEKMFV